MLKWQIFSGVLLFVCSVGLAPAGSQASDTQSTENALPALACRFETHVRPHDERARNQTREWYLWRQPDLVEMRDADGKNGQIWRRDTNGQVSYQRVFHAAKRIIEYYPGDLRALQSYPEWQKLAGIIDPAWLGSFVIAKDEVTILNRQARRYTGQVDGQEFDVLWLEQEQIPARVRRKNKEYEEVVELKEIHSPNESPWPRNETVGYELLDYADLGDKESDPFVRTFLHGGGVAHEHAH
jgi:hypothetical protein